MVSRSSRIARILVAASSFALIAGCATMPAPVAAPAAPIAATDPDAPAPLSQLVDAVDIPYQQFALANGLRVLVHEDRKAPVVGVSVWYAVGSKNEPKGKTGFAHLFEHLMFNGSENAPGDFFEPLQQVGATDFNGTTWFDRTNYFETVPTGALDRALMLESDRMGHLLGAVTQEKLDNQRGVVQNEKRQGDNQPYGLVEYEQLENLYPAGHPYHHSTIGSMDDLNSASLDDVKKWFTDHYGPNNAILVLAGDIDLATAKAKVSEWFGDIPAGPAVAPIAVPVPTLAAPVQKTISDQVATTRIYRMWAIPGLDSSDSVPLALSGLVLGGLSSSRLDNSLVRQDQLAVAVSSRAEIFAQGGQFVVSADVKPGVDPATVAAALDAQIADYLATGPTADELQRSATSYAAQQIRSLESVGGFGGKAPTLAEGLLYSGNPAQYKVDLKRAAQMTPAEVKAAADKWLTRPVFALTIEPGERKEGGENRGGYVVSPGAKAPAAAPAYWRDPALGDAAEGALSYFDGDRSKLPAVGTLQGLDFPDIERGRLANGMEIYFARRAAVPTVTVRVAFDAGYSADPKSALGTESLMLQLMDEGTTSLDSTQLAIAQERLGASINATADGDSTSFQLDALAPNLAPSLDLLADFIRNPAFAPDELERVRAQQLNRIKGELTNPAAIGQRALLPILYGDQHPYGIPPSGTGDPAVVAKLTRTDLATFHDTWLRPDNAKIFVVGDSSLAEVTQLLNRSFGDWQAPATALPTKNFAVAVPKPSPRVVLIDRPNSPQSIILAGRVLDVKGSDDLVTLNAANEVFGGSFLSRINMNLRETKGWSYGVRSIVQQPVDRSAFVLYAPVQADRTGDSIKELRKDLTSYVGDSGVTAAELERTVNGNVRELPGQFETSGDVLGGMVNIVKFGRPDNYYETLADKYRSLSAAGLDAEARKQFLGNDLVFVVVGDAKVVRPQLDGLGLAVEERAAQ
ncbi:MAG: insulinase family protein [Sphingomonadales bacterium]|nr:insulinase family protein [Sphingomonadales bacterium]